MLIKFRLNLGAKSSLAYSTLQSDSKTGGGILVLQSLCLLRDYKNYIHPSVVLILCNQVSILL